MARMLTIIEAFTITRLTRLLIMTQAQLGLSQLPSSSLVASKQRSLATRTWAPALSCKSNGHAPLFMATAWSRTRGRRLSRPRARSPAPRLPEDVEARALFADDTMQCFSGE